MKVNWLLAALMSMIIFSTNAHSAAYFCQGSISAVTVSPDGVVNVHAPSAGLSWVYLCQIGGNVNGVSSEACKAVLASLLSAKATDKAVQWGFNDSLSCGTRPGWTYLTGWYWGPTVSG